MIHSKQKGNLGFSATVKELHKLNLNVFIELGDYSKIDIIAEYNNKLIKIQVKYATEKNGVALLPLRKCGPNGYKYKYTTSDVDLFSVYLPLKDKVLFIPASLACQNVNSFQIRFDKSINNQKFNVHYIEEFENLENILKTTFNI